jgi:N-acetylneuraminic acid mutarotase
VRGIAAAAAATGGLLLVSSPASAPTQWRTAAPLPLARSEVAAALVGREIAVVGGFVGDGGSSARVDLFSPGRNRWRRLPDLPVRVNHAMAAAHRGRLYVVGGYGEGRGPLTSAFVFRAGRWRKLASLPEPRAAAGAAIVGTRLVIAGGVGPSGLARRVLVLDLSRGRWSSAPGPTPREHLGVTALAGRVYALGGRTAGFDTNLDLVQSWAPGAKAWRKLPVLPGRRGGTGAAAVSGAIVSAGGEQTGGTIPEVYAYRPGSRSWSRLPDLPTPRHGLGVVGFSGRVYVIGGGLQPGLHVSTTNEFLQLGR